MGNGELTRREKLAQLKALASEVDAAYGTDLDLSLIISQIDEMFSPHVVTGIEMSFPLTESSGLADAQVFAQKEVDGIDILKSQGNTVVSMINSAINGESKRALFNGLDRNGEPITVRFSVYPSREDPLKG